MELEGTVEEKRAACHRLVNKIFTPGAIEIPAALASFRNTRSTETHWQETLQDQAVNTLRSMAMELFPDEIAGIVAAISDPSFGDRMSAIAATARVGTEAYQAAHPAPE